MRVAIVHNSLNEHNTTRYYTILQQQPSPTNHPTTTNATHTNIQHKDYNFVLLHSDRPTKPVQYQQHPTGLIIYPHTSETTTNDTDTSRYTQNELPPPAQNEMTYSFTHRLSLSHEE